MFIMFRLAKTALLAPTPPPTDCNILCDISVLHLIPFPFFQSPDLAAFIRVTRKFITNGI